jgi:hypothetical protein
LGSFRKVPLARELGSFRRTNKKGAVTGTLPDNMPASHQDSGLEPRRHIMYRNGASRLAAGQRGKPETAHVVDWVYVTSSFP